MIPTDPYDAEPIRAILHRAVIRYLTVTRAGLRLRREPKPVREVSARVLGFGGAKTLYRKHRPVCRSLNGVISVTDPTRSCATCDDRRGCTNQVRVDLVIHTSAYRCLLAFTSAENFLRYDAGLRQQGNEIEAVDTLIRVVDRGTWGELRFSEEGSTGSA